MTTLDDLLAAPVAPVRGKTIPKPELTRSIAVTKNTVEAEIRDREGLVNEGTGLEYLKEEGLNPDEWEATHFRKIKYGQGMESVKFSYKRVGLLDPDRPDISELIAAVKKARPSRASDGLTGEHAFILALGDMQFGKADGDGPEGALKRALAYIDQAGENLKALRKRYPIGHIHVAWLGDHIEGFVSQGGANTWRTQLTLNEQIRLTRRVMLYAVETFAPLSNKVTMAAVPGNHGEPQRFNGKGVTRYDDSHDTEALVAVADACKMNEKVFGHVEFYVPEPDEMTVVLEMADTVVGHVHGHQFRPGKHMQWWQGQTFGGSPLGDAQLLLAGHLHHFHVDTSGPRTFLQVPALEGASTWWRHATGERGNPGAVVLVIEGGLIKTIEVLR